MGELVEDTVIGLFFFLGRVIFKIFINFWLCWVLLHRLFSSCGKWGLFSGGGTQASH